MPNNGTHPAKVAILGGGVGGLVTAFELTNQPGWRDRWDITLYQMGWRLGGKGASGRNQDVDDRIEEHGLHILFGNYENTFAVLRQVYRELGRHPNAPLATWKDAFKPGSTISIGEHVDGVDKDWVVTLPRDDAEPGDGALWPTSRQWLERLISALLDVIRSLLPARLRVGQGLSRIREDIIGEVSAVRNFVDRVIGDNLLDSERLDNLQAVFLEAALDLVGELDEELDEALDAMPPAQRRAVDRVQALLVGVRRWIAELVGDMSAVDDDLRRLFLMVDLMTSAGVGMLADGVLFPRQDWFKIDDEDLADWLRRHGASERTVTSAVVESLRDAVYSSGRGIGAGTALLNALRVSLAYKGAAYYRMQAGMGDVVFAPLYIVLKRRGVRFRFFHEVEDIRLSDPGPDGKRQVESVHIGIQATLEQGDYEPLIDVGGLPCWPSRPLFDQLVEGQQLQNEGVNLENWWSEWTNPSATTLQRGVDFDVVVSNISVASLPYVANELVTDADNPAFGQMVSEVQTTQSIGAQLWLRPTLDQLGWRDGRLLAVHYDAPIDTWADMSHLIKHEAFDPAHPVGCEIYLTSDLPDDEPLPSRDVHSYPLRQQQRVFERVQSWLNEHAGRIWPDATTTDDPDALNLYWLHAPDSAQGVERLEAQFWVATWNPSDRYVLVTPGSNKYRLRPSQSGYDNLVIVGDWTLTPISSGSVESATMSGMMASRHLSGFPEVIVGDWLPAAPPQAPPPE